MTEICQNIRNFYNSTLSNKDIDDRGFAEIYKRKTENSTSTLNRHPDIDSFRND